MTMAEAAHLLKGIGWIKKQLQKGYYVGSIPAIPRLGLPSINMQDSAAGFRTFDDQQVGQVTSWPCSLALAASWDAELTEAYAAALGREFRAKGANVVLGPSVNVHHVPYSGRNAEYLAGEEPSLGAVLAGAYVRGVQGEGVAAVVKHFVLNGQETRRHSQSSIVDPRTLWEVYYPPFVAAMEAGVASVMCSYNKVGGSYACGNDQILLRDLKQQMGFEGWVMSDWWAVHSTEAAKGGVDQEMPGTAGLSSGENGAPFFGMKRLQNAGADLKEMARRLLYGLFSAGALDGPICDVGGGGCSDKLYRTIATSDAHQRLARKVAAESAVLLKNERRALPIAAGAKVALLGPACDSRHTIMPSTSFWDDGDYYVIGGSGRVISDRARSLKQGLEFAGVKVITSASREVDVALTAMRSADVAIVCGGASSREATDRQSLSVDQNEFIQAVANGHMQSDPPLVAAVFAPGSIHAPWHDRVDAMLTLFLAGCHTPWPPHISRDAFPSKQAHSPSPRATCLGEAHGYAWADVLLGKVTPSGKLPVTFPLREEDVPRPCTLDNCTYSEKLNVGWRGLHSRPVAFPFGCAVGGRTCTWRAPSYVPLHMST